MSTSVPSPEFGVLQRAVAGRYSLVREIGRGGMAVVFLARDVGLDRLVAIKLLRPDLLTDPASRARFLREARTAARLFHPNIVPVHAVEEEGDLVFLVMAYVDGETLGQRVRRAGPLSPMMARRVMQEVAWALDHAHAAGVVHLDVKPDNVLLERGSGRAMATDFGIARLSTVAGGGHPEELLGTVQYMSPEQLVGGRVDERSDLYSLGVTAFFAVTGRLPHPAMDSRAPTHELVRAKLGPALASAEGVPPRLARVIDRCLRGDPEMRHPSAAVLAAALAETEALPFGLPVAGRRLVRGLRQLVVLTGVAVAVLFVWWPQAFLIWIWLALVAVGLPGLLRAARALLRQGLDADAVSRILLEEVKELASAGASAEGPGDRLMERLRNLAVGWGPAPLIVLAAAWAVLAPLLPGVPHTGPAVAFLMVAALLLGSGPGAAEDSPVRKLDLGERLLVGRFGRLLFRLAGIGGAGEGRERVAAAQPTEVLLASAAENLFRELPAEYRDRFGDVPAVARRLEERVRSLRRQDDALVSALARVEIPAGGALRAERQRLLEELEDARTDVAGRLRDAVAALEHLRLNMSRLAFLEGASRGGVGGDGAGDEANITAELERAWRRARELEGAMSGLEEVERLLETLQPHADPR